MRGDEKMRIRCFMLVLGMVLLAGCAQKTEGEIISVEKQKPFEETEMSAEDTETSEDTEEPEVTEEIEADNPITQENDTSDVQEEAKSTGEILDELERNCTNQAYLISNVESIDLEGYVEKRFFDASKNPTGYDHDYYVICLEAPVTIKFEDMYGEIYEVTNHTFQIAGSYGVEYEGKKVCCRVKGWESLIGVLSQWLEVGAIVEVDE